MTDRFSTSQVPSEAAFAGQAGSFSDRSILQQKLPQIYRATVHQFRRISTSFVLFNFFFAFLFAAEVVLLLLFLPFLVQSPFLAASLSGIFLTIFSYFILLFYFQAKKPEQFLQLKEQFLASCRQMTGTSDAELQPHLSIAAALIDFAAYLEDFEWRFYRIPASLSFLHRSLSRFSAFCHGRDVFQFKGLLLNAAIDEHVSQIRVTPTDLEVHASLANTYVVFSKLFTDALRKENPEWEESFKNAARLAIEEFQILGDYAPNDPWVHEQLARGYRDLHMPDEELRELETLVRLRPQDKEVILGLGVRYFERGLNAKGLRIYEELRLANYQRADRLITAYGKLMNSTFLKHTQIT